MIRPSVTLIIKREDFLEQNKILVLTKGFFYKGKI